MFFKKKTVNRFEEYDSLNYEPVIKASICNGEQVAGFLDLNTNKFKEIMLISNDKDLEEFKSRYGIKEELRKIY